jgi:hypothetical protein
MRSHHLALIIPDLGNMKYQAIICLTPGNYDKIKHHYNYSNYQETHFGCKHVERHFVGLIELELGTFKSREPD